MSQKRTSNKPKEESPESSAKKEKRIKAQNEWVAQKKFEESQKSKQATNDALVIVRGPVIPEEGPREITYADIIIPKLSSVQSKEVNRPYPSQKVYETFKTRAKKEKPARAVRRPKVNEEENENFRQANEIIRKLTLDYNVAVKAVQTNREFYSDTLLKMSVSGSKYYISLEDPSGTAHITEYLIRHSQIRVKVEQQAEYDRKKKLLEIAREERTEKSIQTAQDTAPKIKEIKQKYRDANAGKEPSLHKLADLLNQENIPAPGRSENKPSKWYAETVKRVMATEKAGHQK